ncbi:MAG: YhcH/YjgK/YiaL family protein [Vallitaleaceae bacterium]|jgi:YhcH/YjgK/YiaL family protein|nr:YhcH/YjgK/YiaL family protein [Vallitaleaceae bacterium]
MITGHIKNANLYKNISASIGEAITYIQDNDLSTFEVGKYEIDGDNLFVLIQSYAPKTVEAGNCEAHKNYIDIQYIIEGYEQMGYAPVADMTIVDPYDEAKDRLFVKWEGDLIHFKKDMFAIFFPQDAHMPGIKTEGCELVKKAVFKIRV